MSQASWQKPQQPLDTLQGMINAVLIETGKALRAANQKGVKTIGYTDDRLQAFLPNAIDKFHLALDELETDIVRAKAVLGRDLRELQARQRQLENPTMQQAKVAFGDGGESLDAGLQTSGAVAEASEIVKEDETIKENPETMNVSSPKLDVKTSTGSPSQTSLPHLEVKTQDSLQKSTEGQTEDVQTGVEDGKNARDPSNVDTTHGLGISISDTVQSAALEAPAAADLQDTTFDSMFGTSNNDGSDLNFDDFGFSGDDSGNQNDFSGNGGEFDLSNFGNPTNNDSVDPNSLLQGLENFGDGSGEDFNLLDMSNSATNNNGVGDTAAEDYGMSGGDLDMALGMGAHESTFDDLLDGMDFGDGDDDGTGGDMMEHGEFDDAFFGLNSDG